MRSDRPRAPRPPDRRAGRRPRCGATRDSRRGPRPAPGPLLGPRSAPCAAGRPRSREPEAPSAGQGIPWRALTSDVSRVNPRASPGWDGGLDGAVRWADGTRRPSSARRATVDRRSQGVTVASRSQSTQRVPSHQRCQTRPSVPVANTSRRSAPSWTPRARRPSPARRPAIPTGASPSRRSSGPTGPRPEHREHLHLAYRPRHDRGWRGERAAQGHGLGPAGQVPVAGVQLPVRRAPEQVDAPGAPGHRGQITGPLVAWLMRGLLHRTRLRTPRDSRWVVCPGPSGSGRAPSRAIVEVATGTLAVASVLQDS